MSVDASEAAANFKRADGLFRSGQYTESMRLLVELDRRFPNTRNILLAMASCLEKLECLGEAEQICDRLLAAAPDAKAAAMKARIIAARAVPDASVPGLPPYFDVPLRTGVPSPPAATASQNPDRRRTYIVGAVIAVAVLILVFPFALRRPPATAPSAVQHTQAPIAQQQPPADQAAELPRVPRLVIWIVTALISYGVSLLILYPCLRMLGRLRQDTFAANFADLAATMLMVYLWGLIPFVGWILGIMHFMRHYELELLETIGILLVAGLIQAAVITFVVMPLLAGAGLVLLRAAP